MRKQEAGIRGNQRRQRCLAGQLLLPEEICKCSTASALSRPGPVLPRPAALLQALGHRRGGPFEAGAPPNPWFPSFIGCTARPCSGGCGEGELLPGLQSPPPHPCVMTCTPWTPPKRGSTSLRPKYLPLRGRLGLAPRSPLKALLSSGTLLLVLISPFQAAPVRAWRFPQTQSGARCCVKEKVLQSCPPEIPPLPPPHHTAQACDRRATKRAVRDAVPSSRLPLQRS